MRVMAPTTTCMASRRSSGRITMSGPRVCATEGGKEMRKPIRAIVCNFGGTFSTLRCGWEGD